MITKKDIMEAIWFLREKNNTIPDEVINFISSAALHEICRIESAIEDEKALKKSKG